MLHCIFEQHQIHYRVVIIVHAQSLLDVSKKFVVGHQIVQSINSIHA